MESLTDCQANRTRGRVRTVRKNTWTWHGITHKLSYQQNQNGSWMVRSDTAAPSMESLTSCQANRARVGVRKVRKDTAGLGMESLTFCQVSKTRVGVRTVRRDAAEPGMEILTCCQANRTRVGVRMVRRDTVRPGMESLTTCQANRTKVPGMKTMRRDIIGMESLTVDCQANQVRVQVRNVRRDTAAVFAMKSLTSCQVNKTRVQVRTVRWDIAKLSEAPNCIWHPAQYFPFQKLLVKCLCVHTVQLVIIASTPNRIPPHTF